MKSSTTSISEKQSAFQALRQEQDYLNNQVGQLNSGRAKVYAAIEFVKNNDILTYVLKRVGIISGVVQFALGASIAATAGWTGIGVVAGAALMIHGVGLVEENIVSLIRKNDGYKGILIRGYESAAQSLGFNKAVGDLVYGGVNLGLSGYTLGRYVLKPEAWRLFHYISNDYSRHYKQMNGFALAIQAGTSGWKLYSTLKEYQKSVNAVEQYQQWENPTIRHYFAHQQRLPRPSPYATDHEVYDYYDNINKYF